MTSSPTSGGGSGGAEGGGGNSGTSSAGTAAANMWTFGIVVVAALALVVVTLFVVDFYGTNNVTSAASILGIVVPVLAAAFGATLAYNVGDAKGQSTGEEKTRKEVKARIGPSVRKLEQTVRDLVTKIQTEGESEPGSDEYVFPTRAQEATRFDLADLQEAERAVSEVRAVIDGL